MRADSLGLAFAALADRTRRGVVERLRKGPKRAGELAAALSASAPALSATCASCASASWSKRSPSG